MQESASWPVQAAREERSRTYLLVTAWFSVPQGRWDLLWSSPQSDFARTQRRFGPIPTSSVQLIGAAGGIEDDRAANLIQIAGGGPSLSRAPPYCAGYAVSGPLSFAC